MGQKQVIRLQGNRLTESHPGSGQREEERIVTWCFLGRCLEKQPPLAEQHLQLGETFTAHFVVMRLLTPLRVKYEDAVELATPYNRIVQPLPEMRKDTVQLIRAAVAQERRAYILVNNRAEGCAPLTVQALVDLLRTQ